MKRKLKWKKTPALIASSRRNIKKAITARMAAKREEDFSKAAESISKASASTPAMVPFEEQIYTLRHERNELQQQLQLHRVFMRVLDRLV